MSLSLSLDWVEIVLSASPPYIHLYLYIFLYLYLYLYMGWKLYCLLLLSIFCIIRVWFLLCSASRVWLSVIILPVNDFCRRGGIHLYIELCALSACRSLAWQEHVRQRLVLLFRQIHFAIRTNIFCTLYKYICVRVDPWHDKRLWQRLILAAERHLDPIL